MPDFIFHDLEPAEKRLFQLADDVGYLILAEVTSRHNTEKLARIDYTATDLRPFLSMEPVEADEFPEAGQLDDLNDGDEPPARSDSLRQAAGEPTATDLANAAYRWIREQAGANMSGARRCKFKLSVWGPKGDKLLYSTRFSCENPDWDPEDDGEDPGERRPPPTMPLPLSSYAEHRVVWPERPALRQAPVAQPGANGLAPTAAEIAGTPPQRDRLADAVFMLDAIPEGRVWQALGGAVAHHLLMMQEGYDNLAKHQTAILNTQNTQILRNQKVLEELTGQVINMRTGIASEARLEKDDAEGSRVRETLAKSFIAELGGLGRVIASAKFGMNPELVELADIINSSPELAEAIKHPGVRNMLRDEVNRKEFAQLLVLAAQTPDDPPPSPSPANNPPKDEPKAA